MDKWITCVQYILAVVIFDPLFTWLLVYGDTFQKTLTIWIMFKIPSVFYRFSEHVNIAI